MKVTHGGSKVGLRLAQLQMGRLPRLTVSKRRACVPYLISSRELRVRHCRTLTAFANTLVVAYVYALAWHDALQEFFDNIEQANRVHRPPELTNAARRAL